MDALSSPPLRNNQSASVDMAQKPPTSPLPRNSAPPLQNLRPEPLPAPPRLNLRPEPLPAPPRLNVIDSSRLREFNETLALYKAGKRNLDARVQNAERWWKLRNRFQVSRETCCDEEGFRAASSWLHNVITSKHADAVAAYPVPNILPRGAEDREQAELLSKIVPVILKQNDFEDTYDNVSWQKLKTGTGVYKIIWDSSKLWGLGDISVTRRSLLSVFWEPGICDIQSSKYLFDVELVDREEALRLAQTALGSPGGPYLPSEEEGSPFSPVPQSYNESAQSPITRHDRKTASPTITRSDREAAPSPISVSLPASGFTPAPMPTDDRVPTENKIALIDVYYKRDGILHYCKYFGETLIYATENDPARAASGLYDHGLYPFVFDTLFPVEGSPAGYGFVDLCANSQIRIDLLSTAILKNALAGATPRYFTRLDGGINSRELLNLENTLVHVNGSLGEDYIRTMPTVPLSGNHLGVLDRTVSELRETSGNTETATGSISGGITAASAIAALQDAAGKGSRAATAASYRAYAKIVNLIIELIRQFYSAPRQFRIAGPAGLPEYVFFNNEGLTLRPVSATGMEKAFRLPVFDINVEPEKKTSYSKLAMNELALQLFTTGFFNPALRDQALSALELMDFEGKEKLRDSL